MNHLDIDLMLDNIPQSKLHGKRILITGGSGFIGGWMHLATVRGSVTCIGQAQYEYGRWPEMEWDYIVHLVPPPETTARVIACAKRNNCPLLFSSSGAVYDEKPGAYALSKIDEEKRLLDSGIDVKIARMFAFAGARMPNRYALINYIWDAIGGGPIKIRGDNVTRSYMYAADMAVWMWRILLDGYPGGVYEVGSETPVTMEMLAHEVAWQFHPRPKVVYDRIYDTDPRPHYVPNTEATRIALGLQEYTKFTDAVRKTVDWYKGEIEI